MPENQATNTRSDVHTHGVTNKDVPPTEVTPRAKRRTFSAQYKLRILEEADRCTQHGEIGALLRCEGLYSSNLTTGAANVNRGSSRVCVRRNAGARSPRMPPYARSSRSSAARSNVLSNAWRKPRRLSRSKKTLHITCGLSKEPTANTDRI